ncbi:hypothetical protein C9374_009300 [Naegleria lovaniensis]|uniref:Uncharacterized protein n=1 Tax=Naegleria lovaniensis TaxID=51637 RepID=A0AA88GH41_NAELO|nr:uncharacterized protein C9374_009300 [Naegleria lovaniensis]KAG2377389.1 hypothetical protein C9374_009300 [Naegleria lovaniensis]
MPREKTPKIKTKKKKILLTPEKVLLYKYHRETVQLHFQFETEIETNAIYEKKQKIIKKYGRNNMKIKIPQDLWSRRTQPSHSMTTTTTFPANKIHDSNVFLCRIQNDDGSMCKITACLNSSSSQRSKTSLEFEFPCDLIKQTISENFTEAYILGTDYVLFTRSVHATHAPSKPEIDRKLKLSAVSRPSEEVLKGMAQEMSRVDLQDKIEKMSYSDLTKIHEYITCISSPTPITPTTSTSSTTNQAANAPFELNPEFPFPTVAPTSENLNVDQEQLEAPQKLATTYPLVNEIEAYLLDTNMAVGTGGLLQTNTDPSSANTDQQEEEEESDNVMTDETDRRNGNSFLHQYYTQNGQVLSNPSLVDEFTSPTESNLIESEWDESPSEERSKDLLSIETFFSKIHDEL